MITSTTYARIALCAGILWSRHLAILHSKGGKGRDSSPRAVTSYPLSYIPPIKTQQCREGRTTRPAGPGQAARATQLPTRPGVARTGRGGVAARSLLNLHAALRSKPAGGGLRGVRGVGWSRAWRPRAPRAGGASAAALVCADAPSFSSGGPRLSSNPVGKEGQGRARPRAHARRCPCSGGPARLPRRCLSLALSPSHSHPRIHSLNHSLPLPPQTPSSSPGMLSFFPFPLAKSPDAPPRDPLPCRVPLLPLWPAMELRMWAEGHPTLVVLVADAPFPPPPPHSFGADACCPATTPALTRAPRPASGGWE